MLLFCSNRDAVRKIEDSLKTHGVVTLSATDMGQAKSLLRSHRATLDLIYIHRESQPTPDGGEQFLKMIKTEPKYSEARDIPVLYSSQQWSEGDFAKHQREAWGANAYLKFPFDAAAFIKRVEGIFGVSLNETTRIALAAIQPVESAPETKINIQTLTSAKKREEQSLGVVEKPFSVRGPAGSETGGIPEVSLSLVGFSSGNESGESSKQSHPFTADSLELQIQPRSESRESDRSSGLDSEGFGGKDGAPALGSSTERFFQKPIGDVVIPGGAQNSPDLTTLKHYLTLREQDVAILSHQLKTARDRIYTLESEKQEFLRKWEDLNSLSAQYREQLSRYQSDHEAWEKLKQQELSEKDFQLQVKSEKLRSFENRMKNAHLEVERMRERMRVELRRVRAKEQELENRLEISKRDYESMVKSRENKIIEIKRKYDSLEFNYEILQEQFLHERQTSEDLREKLEKALQATRAAVGTLERDLSQEIPFTPKPESKRAV